MNEFSGYEKMPNHFKKLGLTAQDFSILEKEKWVVTEKIHGANFSFVYEKSRLKFAKRKEYLQWTDDFFGFQLVVNQLEDRILQLFEQLKTDYSAETCILYGELFGGKYPHQEVEIFPNVQAIQTGVYYSPTIEFCAFDLAFQLNDSESKVYLSYETAISYFKKFEIFYAKPLFIGKMNEAMNFNTKMNSLIPKELNLPELQNNLIEGIVIKPFHETDIKPRPILKIKNIEFDEEEKFHEAEKWSFIPKISSKSEELGYILDELKRNLTKNRLESAISKIGPLDFNNQFRITEIKNELLHDIFVDFNENNELILNELSNDETEWLKKRMFSEINQFLNKLFKS